MKLITRRPRRSKLRREAERGVALIMVMIFLTLMLLLGMAVTLTGITELGVARNAKLTSEAFDVAEAGLTTSHEMIRNMNGDFSCLLQGPDGIVKTGDEFSDWAGSLWNYGNNPPTSTGAVNGGMWATARVNPIPATDTAGGIARTLVRLDDQHFFELLVYDNADDPNAYMIDRLLEHNGDPTAGAEKLRWDFDQRVIIRSLGYVFAEPVTDLSQFDPSTAIATAVTDGVLGLAPYPAVITEGDLNLGGSTSVEGSTGSVHTNDDLSFTGGAYSVAQSATWTDGDGSGGNPVGPDPNVAGGNGYEGYSDAIFIPDLDPYDYAQNCNVVIIDSAVTQAKRLELFAGGDPATSYSLRSDRALFKDLNNSGDNNDEIVTATASIEGGGTYDTGDLVMYRLGPVNQVHAPSPNYPTLQAPQYYLYRPSVTNPNLPPPGGGGGAGGLGGYGYAPASSLGSMLGYAPPNGTGSGSTGSNNNSGGTNTGTTNNGNGNGNSSTTTSGTTTSGTTTSGTTTSGTTTSGTTTSGTTTSGTTTSGTTTSGTTTTSGNGNGGGDDVFGFHAGNQGGWSDGNNTSTDANNRSFFFLLNTAASADASVDCNGVTANISILTNGSVHLNGDFNMHGELQISPPEEPPWNSVNVLCLTGIDIAINGGADGMFSQQGMLYAHEQFDCRGNGDFVGQLVSRNDVLDNLSPGSGPVDTSGSPVSTCEMSGNFTLTFNAGSGFFGGFALVSWRQLHDFTPANARPA